MRTLRDIILKDTFAYTVSNYIVTFIGFFTSTFTKRFLGPLNSGYWALFTMVQSYAGYVGLGTKMALSREVPQAVGRGDNETAERIQDTVFAFLIVSSAVCTVIIGIASFFIFKSASLRLACILVGVLIGVSHIYTLAITILRARKEFQAVSKVIVMNAAIVFVFSVGPCYFFGLIGMVGGMCVANILSYYASQWLVHIPFRFSIDARLLKKLIIAGVPMMGAGFLYTTFISVDKIMIGKMIGVKELGFYTIGIMAATQLEAIPKFFNIVIFPYIQEKFGVSGSIASSASLVLKSMYFSTRFLPFLLGGVLFFMELVVHYLLPQFEPGLGAMRILLFGFFFVILSEIFPTVIYTVDKQAMLMPLYAAVIAVNVGFNFLFIKLGWGIEGVALATSLAYFVFFIVTGIYVMRSILGEGIGKTFLPIFKYFAYFLVSIALINKVCVMKNELMAFTAQMILLTIVSVPIFIRLEQKERFFSSLIHAVTKK